MYPCDRNTIWQCPPAHLVPTPHSVTSSGGLKLVTVRVFILQKWANVPNQGFFFPPECWLLHVYQLTARMGWCGGEGPATHTVPFPSSCPRLLPMIQVPSAPRASGCETCAIQRQGSLDRWEAQALRPTPKSLEFLFHGCGTLGS